MENISYKFDITTIFSTLIIHFNFFPMDKCKKTYIAFLVTKAL